ncbi:MAG: DUF4147 domain-containing protein [Natronomonas sp.]
MVVVDDNESLADSPAHDLALRCVTAGMEAAHPENIVEQTIDVSAGVLEVTDVDGESTAYDLDSFEDVIVGGGGNAAGHLAAAIESALGDHISGGVVVTDDPTETDRIEVLEGDHPIPSDRGAAATERLLETAAAAGPDDLVLAVITGGGSALLPAPAPGIGLEELQETTEALVSSGATIHEINAVRKHLSAIKGGGLAETAAPATVLGVIISDVTGDDLGVIASGPIAPDPTTYDDAVAVLDRYGVAVPSAVEKRLREAAAPETPTADDPVFDAVEARIVANGSTAIDAAAEVAAEADHEPLVLSSTIRGEAAEAAKTHAAIAEECRRADRPVDPPGVILSGGETTVTLGDDPGVGGPNQEFALSFALECEEDAVVASVDTDGIDGSTAAAGAILDPTTVDDGRGSAALASHDVHPLLAELDALIETGPSGTNVNDLRVVVLSEPQ